MIGKVTNRMDCELYVAINGALEKLDSFLFLTQSEADRVRRIRIRLEQQRPARAERAIHIDLNRARRHAITSWRTVSGRLELFRHNGVISAKRHCTFDCQLGQGFQLQTADRHIVQARPAARGVNIISGGDKARHVFNGRRSEEAPDEVHRVINQHARRLSSVCIEDFAPCRRLGGRRDVRSVQRSCIGDSGMTICTGEHDRNVGDHLINIRRHRETAFRPVGLNPSSAVNSVYARVCFTIGCQRRLKLTNRPDLIKVQRQLALADT